MKYIKFVSIIYPQKKASMEEPDIMSEDESKPDFSDECTKILQATGLLAEKLNFEFAEKGLEEWKAQQFAISFGLLQPPPKYSDEELTNATISSLYQQFLLLQGERKDYCAVVGTLFLVIFPSGNACQTTYSSREGPTVRTICAFCEGINLQSNCQREGFRNHAFLD